MLFNSFEFLLFFPIVTALYFLTPGRYRWFILLAASYVFYMWWKAEYVLLIVLSTLVDYFAGIRIGSTESKSTKRWFLVLSIVMNLGLLFVFKYFNFFSQSMAAVFNATGSGSFPIVELILPVGISFYTFQTLSYTIDVYRGHKQPERHLGKFALYVAFFPQLVAGPIERSTRLLPQINKTYRFNPDRIYSGLCRMVWGFFKKIVLADNLGRFVDMIYATPSEFQGGTLLIATYCFAFQIYYDFSGYTDIAIGAGRVFGIRLMENFKWPYLALSLRDFWRRWHISLSTWFRDYMYIPLGGNRVGFLRWGVNILAVFLVCGLWHGANWTFVMWGAIHGVLITVETALKHFGEKWNLFIRDFKWQFYVNVLRIFVVFHLVCLAWIYFRAENIGQANYILHAVLTNGASFDPLHTLTAHPASLSFWAVCIVAVEIGSLMAQKYGISFGSNARARLPQALEWFVYYAGIMLIISQISFQSNQFIYFQF